jgi:hypothetical protein
MSSENPAAEMADLMKRAAGNNAAIDGIRRNLVDWLLAKTRSTMEAGTTGGKEIKGDVYQRTIATPRVRRAMEQAFTPAQMRIMDAVAKDLERAARASNAVKISGSPGTAADLHALGHGGGMSLIVQAEIGEKLGEVASHVVGAKRVLACLAASWVPLGVYRRRS